MWGSVAREAGLSVTVTGMRFLPPHSRTPGGKSEQLGGQDHWEKVPDDSKAQQWSVSPQLVDLIRVSVLPHNSHTRMGLFFSPLHLQLQPL